MRSVEPLGAELARTPTLPWPSLERGSTAKPAMGAFGFCPTDTTLEVVGVVRSPGKTARSRNVPCGTSVVLEATAEASSGTPHMPPTPKVVGVFVWMGVLVVRVSSTRHGGTV